MSAQKIEAELRAFTDSFVNLVRAGRIGDDSAASKKSKVFHFSVSGPYSGDNDAAAYTYQ